jgi:hypothetical protein
MFSRAVFGNTWSYNPETVFFYRKQVPGAISDDRALCSYYRLLADIKISKLYGEERATRHIRRRAEMCMSDSLRSARNTDLFLRSKDICMPFLDRKRQLFYGAAGIFRNACNSILTVASKLRKKKASREAPSLY